MRGRILVFDHRTPTPDQDSGSESAFSYLRILSRHGFELTFLPLDLADAGRYSRALNGLGIRTLAAPKWPSVASVVARLAPRSDILLLYRAPVAAAVFDLARRTAPDAKILFHAVDLHFLRLQRGAALSGDPAQAAAAMAMRRTELRLVRDADATIVVSEYEAGLLRQLAPDAVLHNIPILREAPRRPLGYRWRRTYAGPGPRQPGALGRWLDGRGLRKRRDILFIGGYDHAPNVDAVLWFVREVWPLLRAKGYPHRFIIAGSRVPPQIAALASDRIEVLGYVKTLQPLFARCRLSVAPLRYGGGIKGKIVTSLSHGVPVVATSIAAEGMGLRHDHDVLRADAPEEIADQIMRLYRDDELWQSLSATGYQTFQNRFSLTAGSEQVVAVFDGLMRGAAR